MANYFRRTKSRTKTFLQEYYYQYYKHVSKNSYPDFLIIGALKSGTTSLYQYLSNHSEIVSSSVKETNFFSWEYFRGIKYYLNFFLPKKDINNQLVFEACPHYLAEPKSARRIKRILPKVKIIAILRDPVERAISNYNYFSNPTSFFGIRNPNRLDKRTVNQAFLDDLNGKEQRLFRQYCRLSLFGKQLEYYYQLFESNNILILDFDELKNEHKTFLKKVSVFLNIDFDEFNSFEDRKETISSKESFDKKNNKAFNIYNAQNYSLKIESKLEKQLIDFYSKDVEKLLALTGSSFNWSKKYIK